MRKCKVGERSLGSILGQCLHVKDGPKLTKEGPRVQGHLYGRLESWEPQERAPWGEGLVVCSAALGLCQDTGGACCSQLPDEENYHRKDVGKGLKPSSIFLLEPRLEAGLLDSNLSLSV